MYEGGVNAGSTTNEPCLFIKKLVSLPEMCLDEDNADSENEIASCLSRLSSDRK